MPRLTDLEYRVITILRNLEAGLPVEDNRVEMKAIWPDDPWRAARRIAGHANASGGDEILWIVGADEKARKVMGADHLEVSNWWRQVQSHFSEVAPSLTHLNVPYEGVAVVALLINTERLPFVINNNKPGTVEREVPWREADATRSAKRSDLIQMLVPRQSVPEFQVLGASLLGLQEEAGGTSWHLILELYVKPKTEGRVVIPRHECQASFVNPTWEHAIDLTPTMLRPPHKVQHWPGNSPRPPSASAIDSTADEALIHGPGKLTLQAEGTTASPVSGTTSDIVVQAKLLPVGASVPAVITATLHAAAIDRQESDGAGGSLGGDDPPSTVAKWMLAK